MKSRLLWTVLTYPCLVSLVSAKNGKGALLISCLLFSTIAKCYSPFLLDRLHTVTALCLGIGLWVHVSAEKGSNWVQRWLSLKKSRTSQYFPISIQMNLSLINLPSLILNLYNFFDLLNLHSSSTEGAKAKIENSFKRLH